MQRFALPVTVACVLLASPALAGENKPTGNACAQAVTEAFVKQRKAGSFRMDSEVKAQNGNVQIVEEYILPDRMRQTIKLPDRAEPLETILVGAQAWTKRGGHWQGLMPAVSLTIITQVRNMFIEPTKNIEEYECLDKVSVDGTEYLGYRSVAKPDAPGAAPSEGGMRKSTFYVDPDTGLPAMKIVTQEQSDPAPVFKGVYSYPTDIVIEAYPDAPIAKFR